MICGPKSSGKSTFCRILANALLTKNTRNSEVAFLDLDPGQPEFSPPGEISLIRLLSCNFGPPFSHPTPAFSKGDRLIRAHHIGAVSPKDDPDHYLNCALDLWDHYRRMLVLYPSCSLIINCSGWVQGSGLEVLQELIRCMNLTHIIYTSTTGPMEVVESLVKTANKAKSEFRMLASQPSEFATRTAADLRMMQTLSYFHLGEPEGGNLRWNSAPLSETAPLTVHYAGPAQAIFGIMFLGEEQDMENLVAILAGCVVGLVIIEDNSAIPVENSENAEPEVETQNGDEGAMEDIQGSRSTLDHPSEPVFHIRRGTSHDSDSDNVSVSTRKSSSVSPCKSKDPSRTLPNANQTQEVSGVHLCHPSISRTVEGLPYISPKTGFSVPLDPSKSRSLGQALVRGIDCKKKTLYLISPILASTLQSLHEKKVKIILVRGSLDTPVWAYREELVAAATRRRKRKDENGEPERLTPHEVREWAKGIPWARVADGREVKSQGAKVWRVKRHLRPRVGPGEETSD